MACDAVAGVVVHFVVLLIHLGLVVAGGASPDGGVIARMALRADTIGIAMIQRESVIKRRVAPVIGVVTLTALAREMIGWFIGGVAT